MSALSGVLVAIALTISFSGCEYMAVAENDADAVEKPPEPPKRKPDDPIPEPTPTPKTNKCDGVANANTCKGDVAISCNKDTGALTEVNCATDDKVCKDMSGTPTCVAKDPDPTPTPTNWAEKAGQPCTGLPEKGVCEGEKAVICEDDKIKVTECYTGVETCRLWNNPAVNVMSCMSTACGDLADGDKCSADNKTVSWCQFDEEAKTYSIQSFACGDYTCIINAANLYGDCY